MMSREENIQWFRSFVTASPWRFAKTYVESYPHEYTLQTWCDSEDFSRAVACIEQWGVVEPFWSAERSYFYVDDRKYWHMGDPAADNVDDRPTLINRSWLDVARYREHARKLGYDDSALDRLVRRWQVLLAKAGQSSRVDPK